MSVDEVMDAILRDRDFYEASGDGNEKGGVTFSGGEPLLQKDFLPALLAACKAAGISTAIETALNVPAETLLKIIPYTGLFLADLKHPQESELKAVTGADLGLVVGNLALLVQSKAAVIVRIPIIPGYNDTLAIMEETALLLDVLGLHQVELLPVHNFGEAKCWSLGISYAYTDVQPPSPNLMNILRQPFETGSFSSVMPHNKI
jgi:pyruvate formate lyase activating enzyme